MKKPKVVAIVQARLGSTRLPAKSLLALRGEPIIDWVAQRLARAKSLDEIVFALPATRLDDALAWHLESRGQKVCRGSENDVLSRFVQAADQAEADYVVRVCADNPLVWWEAVDRLVEFYLDSDADYAYNHIPRNNLWPDGLGAEILSAELLRQLESKAKLASQREHCLNYIWDNPGDFKIATFDPAEAWLRHPGLKLDIDSLDDYQRLAALPISPAISGREMIGACLE